MATPLRVLILEDNANDALLMIDALRRGGFAPIVDRAEMEQEYREHLLTTPQIILADFSMPGFDALQALEIMQQLKLVIPFIIVSGTIGEERAVQVMQRGASDFILKDRLGRLAQAVTQALARKDLFDSNRLAEEALVKSRELSRVAHESQLREQVGREVAEQSNRAMDQFFSTLSHELRTPLTPIMGWCRMLLDGGLDEPMRLKGLSVIMRNVKMQTRLVDDILDVSRIISGKLLLDVVTSDISRILEAAMEVARPSATHKKIELKHTAPEIAIMVVGDPHRLEQVFSNLLTNAVKFTPDGGVIEISVESGEGKVVIRVRDSGMGIRPDFLLHVFERFSQADSSSIREHGGLGIGLSLVKHLTELHGGTVSVESEGEGKGTTFTVSLPTPPTQTCVVTNSQSTLSDGLNTNLLKNVKLLIVEDEPDARDFLEVTFNRHGARVSTASSVPEAMLYYKNEKPDLLLSDLGMPMDDGFAFIKNIRNIEAKSGKHTPAIAFTAFARDEDRVQCLAAGFQMHVPKPIDPVELIRVVSRLLNIS